MSIKQLTSTQIILINKKICKEDKHDHKILDLRKIESALHTTFYPGSEPFIHGGVAKIAGAMAYYLTNAHAFLDGNKRTALLASTIFMKINGYSLTYPLDIPHNINSLGDAILLVASGEMDIDDIKNWYELHKIKL